MSTGPHPDATQPVVEPTETTGLPSADLTAARARLAGKRGREYWQSLEELVDDDAFREVLAREFPRQLPDSGDGVSRRRFLELMGASLSLAGLGACTQQPVETIVPYVEQPEQLIPGRPLYFATAMALGGDTLGLLAETHMGRPTKLEGNPEHPSSLGAAGVLAQAAILSLYDPDRSQVLTYRGAISTWAAFVDALTGALTAQGALEGSGLRLLTPSVTSPTLASQMRRVLERFPKARWHRYEPIHRDASRAAAVQAFGRVVDTTYDFARAKVVLSLDSDFLTSGPGNLRYARDFASQRKLDDHHHPEMNRLYAVESTPTLTGATADHRLGLPPARLAVWVQALAVQLGVAGSSPPRGELTEREQQWVRAVARDLRSHRGETVVVAGDTAPTEVHVLTHGINQRLGNVGRTVLHREPAEADPVIQGESITQLAEEMHAGDVDTLLILGGNPVYDAPAELDFVGALDRVRLRIHSGLHADETSARCQWHVPAAHPLESWSDVRAHDGTASVVQPMIAPLYDGHSAHEIVAVLEGRAGTPGYDLVRQHWRESLQAVDFERAWRRVVHDGLAADSASEPLRLRVTGAPVRAAVRAINAATPSGSETSPPVTLCLRADAAVYDGSQANNGWLQELPRPLTKLTWDNAALVAPAFAERHGLSNEDVLELKVGERTVEAPVWIVPGCVDDTVTLHLGYGRTRAGRVGDGVGTDAYPLRTVDHAWNPTLDGFRRTGARIALACTQTHHSMEGRHPVRVGTLEQYGEHPEFVHEMGHAPAPETTLLPQVEYDGYAWGMSIDLNSCIGCNACVVACQSENNIPVVGKEQVIAGREMHWLRIDRYYHGPPEDPETYHQPVACHHCEHAPCEIVCPVGATVHSDEGLNDMVYNRCVGTRYCSNNCPYKVRRFNFLTYNDYDTPVLDLARNPDVTVRSRGVMEKCSYCVQRINTARIDAKRERRSICDGDIQTACQQTCPTQAIHFGDVNDSGSVVSKLKSEHRDYGLLEELNTRPRTSYLARIRNPNPELEGV